MLHDNLPQSVANAPNILPCVALVERMRSLAMLHLELQKELTLFLEPRLLFQHEHVLLRNEWPSQGLRRVSNVSN